MKQRRGAGALAPLSPRRQFFHWDGRKSIVCSSKKKQLAQVPGERERVGADLISLSLSDLSGSCLWPALKLKEEFSRCCAGGEPSSSFWLVCFLSFFKLGTGGWRATAYLTHALTKTNTTVTREERERVQSSSACPRFVHCLTYVNGAQALQAHGLPRPGAPLVHLPDRTSSFGLTYSGYCVATSRRTSRSDLRLGEG